MEEFESKLVPILREGVETVKMIFFKKLKTHLSEKYSEQDPSYINKLTGAIVNEVFGVSNQTEPFASFVRENKDRIRKETKMISTQLEEMRIPLTDALRIQFLCDSQQGINSLETLNNAKAYDILITERDIPLPNHFLSLARTLGTKLNILHPMGTS